MHNYNPTQTRSNDTWQGRKGQTSQIAPKRRNEASRPERANSALSLSLRTLRVPALLWRITRAHQHACFAFYGGAFYEKIHFSEHWHCNGAPHWWCRRTINVIQSNSSISLCGDVGLGFFFFASIGAFFFSLDSAKYVQKFLFEIIIYSSHPATRPARDRCYRSIDEVIHLLALAISRFSRHIFCFSERRS